MTAKAAELDVIIDSLKPLKPRLSVRVEHIKQPDVNERAAILERFDSSSTSFIVCIMRV